MITDPSAIDELFALTGRKLSDYVTLLPRQPLLCLILGERLPVQLRQRPGGARRQIGAKNPADVAGYRRFLAYSEAVFEEGYLKLGTVPFLSFRDMVRVAPQLMKLESWRSVYGIVSRFIKDEELRQAFSFHSLLVGGNPFATSSIYALIHALERRWGVWFPRGGTGALVRGMVKLFEDLGGTVRLNSPVDRILTENGRVSGVAAIDGWSRALRSGGLQCRRRPHL